MYLWSTVLKSIRKIKLSFKTCLWILIICSVSTVVLPTLHIVSKLLYMSFSLFAAKICKQNIGIQYSLYSINRVKKFNKVQLRLSIKVDFLRIFIHKYVSNILSCFMETLIHVVRIYFSLRLRLFSTFHVKPIVSLGTLSCTFA